MPVYQVERLYGEELLSSEWVEEEDPMKAAEKVGGRPVSPRGSQDYWYRVVGEREATVHEFSLAHTDESRDFAK